VEMMKNYPLIQVIAAQGSGQFFPMLQYKAD
jgi:hypothetical protein